MEKFSQSTLLDLLKKSCFIFLFILSSTFSSSIALLVGILFAIIWGNPFILFSKKVSKITLQISVIGLGFGMNLFESLSAGRQGMLFTIISVVGIMILGFLLGKVLKIDIKNSYLISAGTAICGGSAIATIAPTIDADDDQITISLATIFILNAIALFIFPPLGNILGLSEQQFGTWAAIAIHDTSSVVGAGATFGEKALQVATTIKLTRALWIIPLALCSMLIFHKNRNKISIPWFIFLFVIAMIANTFLPIPETITSTIVSASRKVLCMTLFLIGAGISFSALRRIGIRPMTLGVLLWGIISLTSLIVVILTV